MAALYEADKVLKDPNYGTKAIMAVKTDTPFTDSLGETDNKMTGSLHSWEVRGFDIQTEMATVEGVAKTSGWVSYVGKQLQMYCEYMRSLGYQVTRQSQATKTATTSAGQTLAEQIAKDVERFKLGRERIYLSNQECQAQALPATPRKTRGAMMWLSPAAQAVLPVDSEFRPPTAARHTGSIVGTTLTEAALMAMFSACFDQIHGSLVYNGYVGSALMAKLTAMKYKVAYVANADQNKVQVQEMNDGVMRRKVEFFDFPFGAAKIFLSPNIAWDVANGTTSANTAYSGIFIVPKMWKRGVLIPFGITQQIDNGEGPHGFHESDELLECQNPQGQPSILATTDA